MTTAQYKNYQTFNILQLRPMQKSSIHSFHIDLRDTKSEKLPFVGYCPCFDVYKIFQFPLSTKYPLQNGCVKTSRDSIL